VQQLRAHLATVLGQVGGVFQQVEQAPAVAVGGGQEDLETFFRQAQVAFAKTLVLAQRGRAPGS